MKSIPLSQGKFALVDDEDYEWLSQFKWQAHTDGYASRSTSSPPSPRIFLRMHREIMQAPPGMEVDHINHDRLDNRKSNLRVCTRAENQRNQLPQVGRTSQYKGVTWHKDRKKWMGQIIVNKRRIHLGYFPDEIAAALAYDDAARIHFGEFAYLNLPGYAAAQGGAQQ